MKFAIIDIETTGASNRRNKITEIGIVHSNGEEVTNAYQTLINPGISIPYFITRLTGIDNEMVRDAPQFYEVAKEIVEWTEGRIFVAHNVQFDYGFLHRQFKSLGYPFRRKRLCTLKMSRKAFPGLKSYSLGKLINEFNISVADRHRALDDALVSAKILHKVLQEDNSLNNLRHFVKKAEKDTKCPLHIAQKDMTALPEECGVYYFLNKDLKPIYIGKANNIKKRIIQHFRNNSIVKEKMRRQCRSIKYELTGNALHALLLEDLEIKTHRPKFNVAQKRRHPVRAVLALDERNEFPQFTVTSSDDARENGLEILNEFRSVKSASLFTNRLIHEKGLCVNHEKELMDYAHSINLFNKGKDCRQAPAEYESVAEYLDKVKECRILSSRFFHEDFYILERGRNKNEKSVVKISGGQCTKLGFCPNEADKKDLDQYLSQYSGGKESNGIIFHYLQKRSSYRILPIAD